MRENMKYNPGCYQLREQQLRRMLEVVEQTKTAQKGGVVFFGDSTIQMYDLERWFEELPVKYNSGIGGATSGELLWMIDEGVIKYDPSLVVLMMGINDLGNTVLTSPKEIAQNLKTMVDLIVGNLPDTEILILSTLPCQDHNRTAQHVSPLQNNKMVREIFHQLAEMNLPSQVTPIFTMDAFMKQTETGPIARSELYVDDLHLNDGGYEILTNRIKPLILAKAGAKMKKVHSCPAGSEKSC